MARPRKPWTKTIEESGLSLTLRERGAGGIVYLDYTGPKGRVQKSLKTRDHSLAEQRARAIIKHAAEIRFTGATDAPLTIGRLFALYFEHKAPHLSESRERLARMRRDLFLEAWGGELEVDSVSQTHADTYSAGRKSGALAPEHRRELEDEVRGVRDGSIDCDFRWLSSVFNPDPAVVGANRGG